MKIYNPASILFVLLLLLHCTNSHTEDKRQKAEGKDEIEITYIMNEGFIITAKDKKIIIDGLLNFGISTDIQKRMENADSPFNDIDLILSTHDHADHYDANIVGKHLINNEKGIFVSTYQAIEKLQTEFHNFNDISNRVISIYPEENEIISKKINGVEIEMYNLRHGLNSKIQNMGFYINIGNKHILHVGDTQNIINDDLQVIGMNRKKIDISFIPYWYLIYQDNREVFRDIINNSKVIAMHLGWVDEGLESVINDLKNKNPKAIIFKEIFELKVF